MDIYFPQQNFGRSPDPPRYDLMFEQVCKCQNNTSHQITFSIVSTGGAGSIVEVCTGIIKR